MMVTLQRYGQKRVNYDLPDCITTDPCFSGTCCVDSIVRVESLILSYTENSEDQSLERLSEAGITLKAEMENGDREQILSDYSDLLSTVVDNDRSQLENYARALTEASETLARIECQDIITETSKEILQEYVGYLLTEEQSQFDYSKTIDYSKYCSDDYGPYIHLARGLAQNATDEIFEAYDICRDEAVEQRSTESKPIGTTTLYPSPSTGKFTLNFGQERTGVVHITNSIGDMVKQVPINKQSFLNLDLTGSSGLFFINCQYEDSTKETLKTMIIFE